MEYRSWFLCFRVGVNEVAGLILVWPDDNLMGGIPEIVECVADEMLELGEEHPRFSPFAVFAEFDVADHSREAVAVHIGGELDLIEGFGAFDRLRHDLARRVTERRERPSHRIDFLLLRDGLIFRE